MSTEGRTEGDPYGQAWHRVEAARLALSTFNELAVEQPEQVVGQSVDPLVLDLADALLAYVALMPPDTANAEAWSVNAHNAIDQIVSAPDRLSRQLHLAELEASAGLLAATAASLDAVWYTVTVIPDRGEADRALARMADLAVLLPLDEQIQARRRATAIQDVDIRVTALRVLAMGILGKGPVDQRARDLLTSPASRERDRALLAAARDRLATGFADLAAHLALSTSTVREERDEVLHEVVTRQIAWNADSEDIFAHRAILGAERANAAARMLVTYLLDSERVSEARVAAVSIADTAARSDAVLAISQWLIDSGYLTGAETLIDAVLRDLANGAADHLLVLASAQQLEIHLQRGQWDRALALWLEHRDTSAFAARFSLLAEELARASQIEQLQVLADFAITPENQALVTAAMSWASARGEDWSRAADLLDEIDDPILQVQVASRLLAELPEATDDLPFTPDRLLYRAEVSALMVENAEQRLEMQVAVLRAAANHGSLDRARRIATGLPPSRASLPDVQHALAVAEARAGELTSALQRAEAFSDAVTRARLVRDIAVALAESGRLREATALARHIDPWPERVRAFRQIAETQAAQNDVWGLLDVGTGLYHASAHDPAPPPLTLAELADGPREEPGAVVAQPRQPLIHVDGYRLYQSVGPELVPAGPTMPDLDRFSLDELRSDMPAAAPGRMMITFLHYSEYNEKFFSEIENNSLLQASQATRYPRYLFLESGVFDLPSIAQWARDRGEEDILEQEGRIYTLRLPLLIGPKATLVITGADVEELRLSREKTVYLVNAGTLYLIDSALVGWSELESQEADLTYATRRVFRPFYIAWSGSDSWIGGSRISSLGYQSDKSYGLSFSSGPLRIIGSHGDGPRRPSGAIIDTLIQHLLYGYYSYEADDMLIAGNTFESSIVYGADPHDRSRNLVFAFNSAFGTQVKHGFIGSREVDQAWWIGNIAFDNHGSGLMLDRDSIDNTVYANLLFDNDQDGITVFESACALIGGNLIFGNARNGVLVRNSWQIALYDNAIDASQGKAIMAYAKMLDQPDRDLELDSYTPATSITIVGNRLSGGAEPLIGASGVRLIALGPNRFMSDRIFAGGLLSHSTTLLSLAPDGVVVVEDALPPGPQVACSLEPIADPTLPVTSAALAEAAPNEPMAVLGLPETIP